MSKVLILGALAVAVLLLAAVALGNSPPSASSAEVYSEWVRAQASATAIAQQSEIAAGQASVIAPVATAVQVILLLLLPVGLITAGVLGVLAWRQRLAYVGPVAVAHADILDGSAADLQRAWIAAAGQAEINRAAVAPVPHTYSPHIIYHAKEGAALAVAPELAAPVAVPTFADLLARGDIAPGRPLLLGYTADGQPLTGSLKDLYSTAVGGVPGAGKTTTVRLISSQTVLAGGRLLVFDPHADAGADSLAGTLAPLRSAFLAEPASSPKEMLHGLALANDVMRARLAGGPVDFPLVACIDEFSALMGRSDLADPLAELIEAIGAEGRKVQVFALISGQIWTAQRAGSTALRDCLASAYVHRMKRAQARMLIDTDSARKAEGLATGSALLARTSGEIVEVTIPQTTAADMHQVAALLPTGTEGARFAGAAPALRPALRVVPPTADRSDARSAPAASAPRSAAVENEPTLSVEAARVLALFRQGADIPQIIKEVHGIDAGKGGDAYRRANREVQALIRQALGGAADAEGRA